MLLALNGKYKSKTPSVLFVHDRFQGWKLFATNAFYVDEDGMISSFLLKSDADKNFFKAKSPIYALSGGSQIGDQIQKITCGDLKSEF